MSVYEVPAAAAHAFVAREAQNEALLQYPGAVPHERVVKLRSLCTNGPHEHM